VVSDVWIVLMALMAIVAPLWLAWALLGWSERRGKTGQPPRGRDER
jgi:ABC-type transporter Mla subunit MlaD